MNNTRNTLSKETIYLLEQSRKDMNKFALERKVIFQFLNDSQKDKVDLKEWEAVIEEFKKKIKAV